MRKRLARIFDIERPFILHVGSNLRRKNRDGVVRIFARTKNEWNGQLVLAGDPLDAELHSLGTEFGVSDRIVSIVNPESELLEALYSAAVALVYPSRFEGFGWPIIEAQACGCPVICRDRLNRCRKSQMMRQSCMTFPTKRRLPQTFCDCSNPAERDQWSRKSCRMRQRYRAEEMISHYIALYRELGARV